MTNLFSRCGKVSTVKATSWRVCVRVLFFICYVIVLKSIEYSIIFHALQMTNEHNAVTLKLKIIVTYISNGCVWQCLGKTFTYLFVQKSTQFHLIRVVAACSLIHLLAPEMVHVKKFTKFSKCNCFICVVCVLLLHKIFCENFFCFYSFAILFDLSATKMSNSKLNVFERVCLVQTCDNIWVYLLLGWCVSFWPKRNDSGRDRERLWEQDKKWKKQQQQNP